MPGGGEREDPGGCVGIASSLGVGLIQTVIFVYDFVTFPLYFLYQVELMKDLFTETFSKCPSALSMFYHGYNLRADCALY